MKIEIAVAPDTWEIYFELGRERHRSIVFVKEAVSLNVCYAPLA